MNPIHIVVDDLFITNSKEGHLPVFPGKTLGIYFSQLEFH